MQFMGFSVHSLYSREIQTVIMFLVLQNPVKDLLLHVHGQKFQLENNGQCLRRLDKRPGRQRVDIGGVTFVSSSSGSSLTRTNYHTARSIIL